MKKQTTTIVSLLVLLLIILGGYWIWQVNQSKPNQDQNTQQNVDQNTNQTQEPEVITSDIDTSDWLTYRNEELGFEFRHPANVTLVEESDDQIFQKKLLFKFPDKEGYFWLSVKENPLHLNAVEIKDKFYKNDTYSYHYAEKFISIDGIESYKQGRYDLGIIEYYSIPTSDKIFVFNFEFNFDNSDKSISKKYSDLINLIISSFSIKNK